MQLVMRAGASYVRTIQLVQALIQTAGTAGIVQLAPSFFQNGAICEGANSTRTDWRDSICDFGEIQFGDFGVKFEQVY